jgi:hypothetical protein
LEARHSKQLKKASSFKSISTLNNTFTEIVDEFNTNLSASACKASDGKTSPGVNPFNVINPELSDWKKDMEKSLETILEKVSTRNSSNVLVELLEKRINDINGEFSKLKKSFEENVDNSNIIKRNIDKFDRSEKLITGLLTQIAEMKNNNIKWQSDFLRNLNDFNEKLLIQETAIEQYENLESIINKKIENESKASSLKREEYENKINDKIKFMEQNYESVVEECSKIHNKFKEEIIKAEVNNKALWDSFALLSSTVEQLS